jgi:polyhydroxyalkanoate synthesis regulator phasin
VSTMQSEVFEALRAIDIPEDKALKAASALSLRDTDVAAVRSDVATLKTDVVTLTTDVATLKTDVAVAKTDVAVLKTDVAALKTDVTSLKADVTSIKAKDLPEIRSGIAMLKWMVGTLYPLILAMLGMIAAILIHLMR